MAESFLQEFKRRNVFRVAVVYLIVSWVLMQIGDVMFPALRLPEWTTTLLVAFLLLGFPIALVLSWAFEATADGIKRTADVAPDDSITASTGSKINYYIIAALVAGIVILLARDFLRDDHAPSTDIAIADKSIAVLPFANRSAAAENAEFFAAGVHDELLTLLSRLGGIKVISRTSVENLDEGLGIPEIGALLGVATVLEGQVQRAGDKLRINVQLISVAQEDHLWATTYDRQLTASNVFEVQSEIARTIADSLHAELSDSDEALLNNVPTENTEALRLYMLGRQLMARSSFESEKQAARYFEDAVALDSQYAQAWTALASVNSAMSETGLIEVKQYIAVAKPAIATALAINPNLAEAHAQQAALLWRSGELEAAEASFQKALKLDPDDANSLLTYGEYLRKTGRSLEAVPVLERALEADPLSVGILFDLGKAEMYVGHAEKTLQYAQRVLEIDPSSVRGYVGSLQAELALGHLAQAWPWFVKTMASDPDDFEAFAHAALLTESMGASDWADHYLDYARTIGPSEPVTLKCELQILEERGQINAALAIAEKALMSGLDDRWSSNLTFLRTIRDQAVRENDYAQAFAWYRKLYPELFGTIPGIDHDNVNSAANLVLLMRQAGETEAADTLVDAAFAWYQKLQIPGIYDEVLGTVDIELLTLKGDKQAALGALRNAVDSGWRYAWQSTLSNMNFDSIRNEPEFQAILAELEQDRIVQLAAIRALPDMGRYDFRYKEFE